MDPYLQPREEEVFKAGLWMLHEETAKLPPLTDRESPRVSFGFTLTEPIIVTGQVSLNSQTTVVKGAFNDIYIGMLNNLHSGVSRI